MHGNDGTIILLYLLFPESEVSDKRDVEVFFDHLRP